MTDELPRPGVAGHLAMNHAILAWLMAAGHDVTILLVGARLAWPAVRYPAPAVAGPSVRRVGAFIIADRPRALLRILAKAAKRSLATTTPPARQEAVLGAFMTAPQVSWCAGYIAKAQPHAVLVDTIFRAPLLQAPALRRFNSVIIAHDVFHRRAAALASAGYTVRPAGLDRDAEAALLRNARAIAAIQPEEAAAIAALCPDQTVFCAPMPALPRPRPPGTARQPDRLVFMGSAALPNLDGLRWFLAEVWPELVRWRPQVRLDLIGDCGAALPRLPAGVTRLGRMADFSPVLHRAALAISPLRVGSGLKIKLLDYARHGLTTVATPTSLQGFAADPAAPFIAAADAPSFALAVVRQLETPQPDQPALDYVIRHYGTAQSFAGLGHALGIGPPAA